MQAFEHGIDLYQDASYLSVQTAYIVGVAMGCFFNLAVRCPGVVFYFSRICMNILIIDRVNTALRF